MSSVNSLKASFQPRLRLKSKLVLILIAMTLLTTTPLTWMAIRITTERLEMELESEVQKSATLFQTLVEDSLQELLSLGKTLAKDEDLLVDLRLESYDDIKVSLEEKRKNLGMDRVCILDTTPKIVVKTQDSKIPPSPSVSQDKQLKVPNQITSGIGVIDDLRAIQAFLPIITNDGESLGTLEIARLIDQNFLDRIKKISGSDASLIIRGDIKQTTLSPKESKKFLSSIRKVGLESTFIPASQLRGKWVANAFSLEGFEGDSVGSFVVSQPTTSTQVARTLIIRNISILSLFVMLFACLIGLMLSKRITGPIGLLVQGTQRITQGDLKAKIEVTSSDEIGTLAKGFNQMITALEKTTVSRDSLVEEVEKRKKAEEESKLARDAAISASGAKSEFLATMSHEIRTPMNSILGMTDLVLMSPLKDNQKKYLEIVKRNGQNLMNLINDILDLSKVESGRLEIENVSFEIRDLLRNVEETISVRTQEKNLSLSFEVHESIPNLWVGDPNRLRQILINLTGNAVKFTTKGGIKIKVFSEPKSSDQNSNKTYLHFVVQDSGIGIPKDKLEAIFSPFAQADSSTTRKFGGTGLGLSISKKFIERMGGKMWVESELGQGSQFHFTLGLEKYEDATPENSSSPENTSEEEEKVAQPKKGYQILMAEDNPDNTTLIEAYLEESPYGLDSVENGAKAFEKFKKGTYNLILMDLHMPEMDGYEATEKIREWEKQESKTPKIPIIALSASALKNEIQKSFDVGCTEHLAKPIDRSTLIETLDKYIKSKG